MRTESMKILRISALALLVSTPFGGPADAAITTYASGNTTARDDDKKFKAKQVASQIVAARVPANFDPSGGTVLAFQCGVNAISKSVAADGTVSFEKVKKIKGRWSAKLLVVYEGAGTVESVELGSGRFKTDAFGLDRWRVTIPTEAFADGFPQNTSALVYGEVRYTKNKKVNILDSSCGILVAP